MRTINLRIPLVTLLLTTALSGTRIARADEPTLVLAGGAEGDRVFGKAGSVVLSASSLAWQHQNIPDDNTGAGASSSTLMSVALNADLFVTSHWSVGVGTALVWSRSSSGTASYSDKSFSLDARLGRAVPLGRFATLWPQLSLGIGREPRFLAREKDTVVHAGLDLPLLFHPTPHLFVGAGPMLGARVGSEAQLVWLAGHIIFGGTFGA